MGSFENGGTGISMDGYNVIKLQPSLADNKSACGTLAVSNSTTGFAAVPQKFPYSTTDPESGTAVSVGIRVFDLNAKFSLYDDTTRSYIVPENTSMSAEINATGAVTYGFNWGVSGGMSTTAPPEAGTYTLNFNAPDVLINAVLQDRDTAATSIVNDHTASITFVVNAGTGSGSGGDGGSGGSIGNGAGCPCGPGA